MLIKAGVSIDRLDHSIRTKLNSMDYELKTYGSELIITSTYEGNHSPGSLHYQNKAIDIRYPRLKATEYITFLRNTLGPNYDVIEENDHIHIEFDPK
jgi:hypothetical protein